MASAAFNIIKALIPQTVKETIPKAIAAEMGYIHSRKNYFSPWKAPVAIKKKPMSMIAYEHNGIWIIIKEKDPYKTQRRSEEFLAKLSVEKEEDKTKIVKSIFGQHIIYGINPHPPKDHSEIKVELESFSERKLISLLTPIEDYVIFHVLQSVVGKKDKQPGHIAVFLTHIPWNTKEADKISITDRCFTQ